MVCSHCGVNGHNYLRCPQLTQEQIKAIKEENKKKKKKSQQGDVKEKKEKRSWQKKIN